MRVSQQLHVGFPSQETSLTGVIPNSAIPQYLTNLPAQDLFNGAPLDAGFNGGWQVIDFDRVRDAVNFDYYFNETNPGDQPGNYLNTYSPRVLTEDTTSGYLMADGRQPIFGKELRFNVGVRYTEDDAVGRRHRQRLSWSAAALARPRRPSATATNGCPVRTLPIY